MNNSINAEDGIRYGHVTVVQTSALPNSEQLPKMIDDAIRTAISKRGVAVIEVPGDFGYKEIANDAFYSSGHSYRDYVSSAIVEEDVDAAVEVLNDSKRTVRSEERRVGKECM